jgi:phosphopantothenoylcysteine synthetase/decarboxylase
MLGPAITVIVCGAPLAARVPDVLSHLLSQGWRPAVVATPAAAGWLDSDAVEALTGGPPRTAFRTSAQPKPDPAAAVLMCPATFNTLNKAAMGAADSYALAQLCEALGSGLPTLSFRW